MTIETSLFACIGTILGISTPTNFVNNAGKQGWVFLLLVGAVVGLVFCVPLIG
jgi:uncharacterized membrane-anchored protein